MIRELKNLSFIVIGAAAMSIASPLAAEASELHAATSPNASIFGTQTTQHGFTTDSGTVRCTQASFEGTIAGQTIHTTTAQELTVTPQYTGCTAFGLNATVDMNGCQYTITGAGQPALTATVDIVCNKTVGKVIEITAAAGCTVTIAPQTAFGHLTFSNWWPDVTVDATLSLIKYEGHGPCPSLPATTSTNGGTYNGITTAQAREDKGSGEATHNGHTFQRLFQFGTQAELTVT
jgi:hypothetical protein